MLKFFGCLAVVLLLGCRTTPIAGPDSGRGILLAQGHIESAIDNLNHAKAHVVDPVGREFIDAVFSNLTSAMAAMGEALVIDDRQRAECAKMDQKLKWEQDHWLGAKTRHLLGWIIGIAAVAWLSFGLLAAWLPAGGLGAAIIRMLPVANIFTRLHRVIHPDPASAVTATIKPFI